VLIYQLNCYVSSVNHVYNLRLYSLQDEVHSCNHLTAAVDGLRHCMSVANSVYAVSLELTIIRADLIVHIDPYRSISIIISYKNQLINRHD